MCYKPNFHEHWIRDTWDLYISGASPSEDPSLSAQAALHAVSGSGKARSKDPIKETTLRLVKNEPACEQNRSELIALLSETPVQKLEALPDTENDPHIEKWKFELDYFNEIKNELLQDETYKDKYVAIKDRKIIDSDTNEFRLVKRINKTYPDVVVLIVEVTEDTPFADFPSPEVL